MATYRQRKKKDGSISVTAMIRKAGHSITETFNEATKSRAMQAAKLWAADTEDQIYKHRKGDPGAARIRLDDFFSAYFEHLDLTGRKRDSTVRNERFSSTQILRLLKPTTHLCDITTATICRVP